MVWCIGQIIDLDLSLAWDTNKSWNHLGIWCVKLLYQPWTCASFRPFCRSWPRLTLWVRTSAAVQLWKSAQTPKWYFGISYLQKPIKWKYLPNWYQQQISTWDIVTHVALPGLWPCHCSSTSCLGTLWWRFTSSGAGFNQKFKTSPMAKLRKPLDKNELYTPKNYQKRYLSVLSLNLDSVDLNSQTCDLFQAWRVVVLKCCFCWILS